MNDAAGSLSLTTGSNRHDAEPFWQRGVLGRVQAAIGHILLVQEDRFLLEHEDGHKQLFLLSHRAPLDPEDLRSFARTRRRVRVAYDALSDMIAGIAERIGPADGVDGA